MPRKAKPKPPDSAKRRNLVYAGALHHEESLVHAYYFVDDGELSERASLYPESLGDFPPGAECSFVVQGKGEGVVPQGAMFVRVWPDDALVTEWRARHDAVSASEAAWASRDLPKPFASLAPIREAYHRLDEERQGVLLAQVVRYIVNP